MKFMPRFMAMTLITLMAGAHAGQAAAPDGDMHRPPRPPMHGMPGEGPMGPGLMWDLQRVKAELKLSPEQEASWQAAVDASKAARESMRKQHDDFRAAIKA